MGRARASVILAAAVLVIAAGLLAAFLLVPSLSTLRGLHLQCSLELDRPAPLPVGTPLRLTFVTSGARGAYDYEVYVDNILSASGTTAGNRFSVPAEFTVTGTSTVTVILRLNGKFQTFLFSLGVS